MIHCGDYSVIILNGKLLYRDHKTLKSTQIDLGGKLSYSLQSISVSDDNLLFLDKKNKIIYSKFTNTPNKNSALKCNLSNRSIYWNDINGNVLWSYPENNSNAGISNTTKTTTITKTTTNTTIKPTSTVKTKIVYIRSLYNNGCIYASGSESDKLKYSATCKEDHNYLWEIPESGSGIWKNVGTNYYITFKGINLVTTSEKSKAINMGDINKGYISNSIWYYNSNYKNLCSSENSGSLTLQECDKNNKNQRWVATNEVPIVTTTTKSKQYQAFTLKGTVSGKAYLSSGQYLLNGKSKITKPLGDQNVELYIQIFLNNKEDLYYTWLTEDTNNPSFWYLSTGKHGATGELSDFCLSLREGRLDSNGHNRLSIVKCSDAKYKFKYSNSKIYVYKNNSSYKINNENMCIRYGGDPSVYRCESTSSYMKWNKLSLDPYIKYNTVSTTKTITVGYVPTPTSQASKPTYLPVKFNSKYDSGRFLTVPKIEENEYFDISSSDKYRTWFVTSKSEPSYLYLSDSVSDNTGKPTKYCLDLSNKVNNINDNYNYLRIVSCSDVKYKFKYDSSNKTIKVYDKNNSPHTNSNNVNVCIYYSETPRVDNCKNTSTKMSWEMI